MQNSYKKKQSMEMTEIIFRAFVDTQFQGCKGKDVAIVIFLKIDAQLPKR